MADEQPTLPTLEAQYADIRTGLNAGRARAAQYSDKVVAFLYAVMDDSEYDMEQRIAAADSILNFIKVP
jgi:hypothetical protein